MAFDWKDFATAGGYSGAKKLGGWAMDFMHPGGDPAEKGMGYLDQIGGQIKPYYDPYINQGKDAMSELQSQYGELIKDPGSILARLGKGYKETPGMSFKREQGLNTINNAAAAGGMAGSMQHQQQAGKLAEDLSDEDYGDYMRQALGLFGTGISGKEKISDRGYTASTGLADRLAQILSGKADYAYEGAAQKNKQMMDLLGMLIGGGSAIGGGGGNGAAIAKMAGGM